MLLPKSFLASMRHLASAGLGLLTLAASAQTPAPQPSQSLHELVADVIYNELQDRGCDSFWEYRSDRVAGNQSVVREQVETGDGPVFRVLADNGTPLDPAARRREDQRLRELVAHPAAMAHLKQDHEQDEDRMRKIIQMMPAAFLYEFEGVPEGDLVRLSFRPNPAFIPSGYEARVVHDLGGTVTINQRKKRLVDMKGQLLDRIDFGYGILGHVEKGGTFEVRRQPVSDTRWKTNLVDVHFQGRLLLFKSVTRDQRESRSDFHPVPHEISVPAAEELLDQTEGSANQVVLTPSSH